MTPPCEAQSSKLNGYTKGYLDVDDIRAGQELGVYLEKSSLQRKGDVAVAMFLDRSPPPQKASDAAVDIDRLERRSSVSGLLLFPLVAGLIPAGDDEGALGEVHQAEVFLPVDYPRRPPFCRMLTAVFHPNIDPQKICIGNHWSAGQSLAHLIVRIGEMICYQSYNV